MTQEVNNSLAQKLAEIDQFPVKWCTRDKFGNLEMTSNVFRIKVAPSPMFGQNIKDFGFDKAMALAETEDYDLDHDFGCVVVRDRSLRKESDGRWYVDLILLIDSKARMVKTTTILVDKETGEPILGEDGKAQLHVAPRKESWVTCELSMLEPATDQPIHSVYRQRDRKTAAVIRTSERSEAIGESAGKRGGRSKGARKRISPDQIAAVLAKVNAE